MNKTDFIKSISVDKQVLEDTNFNPYYQLVQSGLSRKIKINNKALISLGSNDYLGLANKKEVKEEAIRILQEYGVSMCGTPIVVGQTDIHRKLETEIALFLKQGDALVYPSCYQCNMGVFKLLASKDDIIFADKEIHSSLLNGIGLSQAALRLFPHNDTQRLKELLLKSASYRMRFVVVEGLYSTNGDIPPLDKIAKIAEENDAFVIVDDAHGVGVLGREGRGIIEVFNVYNNIDLITGSLGKAIGTFGGFLAGNKNLIDYFRYSSPMYFYSTALPPSIAAATTVALKYVKNSPELREKINKFARKLNKELDSMGFRITPSTTPLVSVIFPGSEDTILATKILYEKGIYTVPFIPPSVPKRLPRIRLTLNANLEEEDIDFVIDVFGDIKRKKPEWLRQNTT